MSVTTVQVIPCTSSDELYRRYPSQGEAQPVYLQLGLEDGILHASYDALIGNGAPPEVFHGRERRYYLPTVLTGDGANKLMHELAPLAQRVVDGGEVRWNGNNFVGVLNEDARAAEDEIQEQIGAIETAAECNEDVLPVWDVDGVCGGDEVEEHGITAATTDEELEEIAARILKDHREGMKQPCAIVDGLEEYLRDLRDQLAESEND
ncbi:hypothetical protein CUT44_14230 [Streptomyces carminius]|uniref:Uncharacterized protein n=1 Tax=Streptomyces carminius TaxID=2665496 RepID=A0A2M8LYT2_9ACTN|nr:hypothetical protein [Streptomyces carminius]PJE97136.1 hypothetical protein CUT44_14230 [Streptomyces carminius]